MADEETEEFKTTGMEAKWEQWVLDTLNFLNRWDVPTYKPGTKEVQPISTRLEILDGQIKKKMDLAEDQRLELRDEKESHEATKEELNAIKDALRLVGDLLGKACVHDG